MKGRQEEISERKQGEERQGKDENGGGGIKEGKNEEQK